MTPLVVVSALQWSVVVCVAVIERQAFVCGIVHGSNRHLVVLMASTLQIGTDALLSLKIYANTILVYSQALPSSSIKVGVNQRKGRWWL